MGNLLMEKHMSGIRLLVADWHGVYVPQQFVEQYDNEQWGIGKEDMDTLLAGPENDWYWETWVTVLDNASYTDENGNEWHLTQDGDLWTYCEKLMSDEEYESFFGEPREEAA